MGTSIIILTYNNLNYTKECIESIRTYTASEDYEIVVIDNNSTDDTKKWLRKQTDIKVKFNKKNRGFPGGCNDGIKIANPKNDILLLNNDVVVTTNWLTNLRTALYSKEEVGAVDPVTNSSSYWQCINTNYNNMNEMQSFAKRYNISTPSCWEERVKLIAYCLLIKREVVDKIGLLDERFFPGNYEDDDYCLRIISAGYRLLLCSDTFVHHYGSSSFSKNSEFYKIIEQNRIKLLDKWKLCEGDTDFKTYYLDFIENKENLKILDVYGDCGTSGLMIKRYRQNCEFIIADNTLPNNKISKKLHKSYDVTLDTSFNYILINQGEMFLNNKEVQKSLRNTFINSENIIFTLHTKAYSYMKRNELIKSAYELFSEYNYGSDKSLNLYSDSTYDKIIITFSKENFNKNIKTDLTSDVSIPKNIISFICAINDEELFLNCKNKINDLEIPPNYHIEIIEIRNYISIASAYNEGMKKAKGKYKVYLKSETMINIKHFIYNILGIFNEENIGAIGTIGCKDLEPNGIWWQGKDLYGQVEEIRPDISRIISFKQPEQICEEVIFVDNLIFITQYDIPWREDIFDGYNFYESAQCMEFKKKNLKIVVPYQRINWCTTYYNSANFNGFEYYKKEFIREYAKETSS